MHGSLARLKASLFLMKDSPSSPFFLVAVEFIDVALFVVVNGECAAAHEATSSQGGFTVSLKVVNVLDNLEGANAERQYLAKPSPLPPRIYLHLIIGQ